MYGLIGCPLGHSLSPQLHRLLGGYDYKLIELAQDALAGFFAARDFDGVNVTIPYKRAALRFCDRLSDEAAACGSVNTIVREADGTLTGHNTDCAGFAFLVRQAGVSLAGKSVAVLGSGGASLAVQYAARQLGAAEVAVVSRGGALNYRSVEERAFDVIVNATPVGMYPDFSASPLILSAMPRPAAVLDIVYNPLRTALCLQAKALGVPAAGGIAMLTAQAAAAVTLFTGRAFSDSEIANAAQTLLHETRNIVLIGMAGCGKTTLGRQLARELGRPFLDLDEALTQRFGMSIPQVFAEKGEAAFRAAEAEAAQEAAKHTGTVIATGGGTVLDAGSLAALRANGVLILLQRKLDSAAVQGRPLCPDLEAARKLYARRKNLYRDAADYLIDNNGAMETTVAVIREAVL